MGTISCKIPSHEGTDNITGYYGDDDYVPSATAGYDELEEDPYEGPSIKAAIIIFNILIFVFGLTGNILVILVVLRNRSMKTTTNFFLVNLAICDLLVTVLVVIPSMYRFVGTHYPFGCVFCKIEQVVFGTATIASAAILTTIAIERYLVIMYPMRMRRVWTAKRMKIIVAFLWVFSTLYSLSPIWYMGIYEHNELPFCTHDIARYGDLIRKQYVVTFTLWYAIPLTVMMILYGHMSVFLWHSAGAKNISIREIRNNISKTNSTASSSNRKNIYKGGSQVKRTESHTVPLTDDTTDKPIAKCGEFYIDYPDETESGGESRGETALMQKHTNGTTEEKEKFIEIKVQDSPNVDAVYTKSNDGQKSNNNCNVRFSERTVTRKSTKKAPSRSRGLKALNERKKVIRLLIALVLSFALCLFPSHLLTMWGLFGEMTSFGIHAVPFATALYLMNSALNPMLYAFLSEQFRKKMKQTLMCKKRQRWEKFFDSGHRSTESTVAYTDQTDGL
ncbi:trissin receptor-like [Antedon mediterranea]|uniref:trissin receptor-like n=1 Tax=Antedon mediterranea TaxID=105859 RepID=UPI003AF9BBF0